MSLYDTQNSLPVAYCDYCGGEVYDNDTVCNLEEVYLEGQHIVHEECVTDSLLENKELTLAFIFDDLCRLQDVFDGLLNKYTAWDFFNNWSDNNE